MCAYALWVTAMNIIIINKICALYILGNVVPGMCVALEYHTTDGLDVNNVEDLRALVVWLEDQKIRHYKIEDRAELRTSTGDNWTMTFQKYLKDLKCPYSIQTELPAAVD